MPLAKRPHSHTGTWEECESIHCYEDRRTLAEFRDGERLKEEASRA